MARFDPEIDPAKSSTTFENLRLEMFVEQRNPPNAVVYSASMSACEEASQWQQALSLLEPWLWMVPSLLSSILVITSNGHGLKTL